MKQRIIKHVPARKPQAFACFDCGGKSLKFTLGDGQSRTPANVSFPTGTPQPKGKKPLPALLEPMQDLIGYVKQQLDSAGLSHGFTTVAIAVPVPIFNKGGNRTFLPVTTKGGFLAEVKVAAFEAYLEKELNVKKVIVVNDGTASAYGELATKKVDLHQTWFLSMAGKSYSACIIDHGTVKEYPYTFSHLPLDPQGPWCKDSGHRGCLKAMAGSASLEERARDMGLISTGQELAHITTLAHTGTKGEQAKARQFYRYLALCLAQAFAAVARSTPVDRFVLGGGISKAKKLLFDPLRLFFANGDHLEPEIAGFIKIKPSAAGANSVLQGLKYLAKRI